MAVFLPMAAQNTERAEVLLETTEGNIRIALFDDTPIHRDNFLKLVEEHCRHERRVGWYAEQLNITPKYLSESVKTVSRRTPNEWIDNYVLAELRVMLRNTTYSIKKITEDMNFPNQSFLGKYFKEHVGMSPSKYRRKE